MSRDYSIVKVSFVCSICRVEIPTKRKYASALKLLDEERLNFERHNFCLTCWEAQTRASYFSFWVAQRPEPEPQKRLGPDPDRMAMFLRALLEREAPEPGLSFVLALALIRKRRLALGGTRWENRREHMTFRWAASNERFELLNPDLTDQQIRELNDTLEALLADPVEPSTRVPLAAVMSESD